MEKSGQIYAPSDLIPGEKAIRIYSRGDWVEARGELITLHYKIF
jgi:hypothetical protein